jgi:Flp pilus assembly pilin Flp
MDANDSLLEVTNNERNSEKGVTTAEYAVMLVLVAIAVLALGSGIAGSITDVFNNLKNNL